jgi:hypothetical protein
MASLTQIFDWFKENLMPTEAQFQETWKSFWHKSERLPQEQILGLNDNLSLKADKTTLTALSKVVDGKADKSDLQNISSGLRNIGEVTNKTDLGAISNPQDGDAYTVINEKDTDGNSYIFRYTVKKDDEGNVVSAEWVNTFLIAFNGDVLTKSKADPKYQAICKNANDFWMHPTGKIVINGASVTISNLAFYGRSFFSQFFNGTETFTATSNYAVILGTIDTATNKGTWTLVNISYPDQVNIKLNSLATNEVVLMYRVDGVWFSAYNIVQKVINQAYTDTQLTGYSNICRVSNDFFRHVLGTLEINGNFIHIYALRFAHKSGYVNNNNQHFYAESKSAFDYIIAYTPNDGLELTFELVYSNSNLASGFWYQKNINDATKTILMYKCDGVWHSSYTLIQSFIDANNVVDKYKTIVYRPKFTLPNSGYTTGYYINKPDGTLIANASYRYIDFDVSDKSVLWGFELIGGIASVVGIVTFYDTDGNYIATTEDGTTGADYDGSQKIWDKI